MSQYYVQIEVFLVSFGPWGVPATAMINNKVKVAVTRITRRQYFFLLARDVCVDF